jgi:hypothetical protein
MTKKESSEIKSNEMLHIESSLDLKPIFINKEEGP